MIALSPHCLVALAAALCLSLPAGAATPPWLERSDRNSAMVFETLGAFQPEHMSTLGVERFDAAARRVLRRLAELEASHRGTARTPAAPGGADRR